MLIAAVINKAADNPIVGSKEYKYKNIKASLVSGKIQVGTGVSCTWKLNNKSDCWKRCKTTHHDPK